MPEPCARGRPGLLAPPLLTCEPVLTEACFLIQRAGGRPEDLIRKLAQGGFEIGIDLEEDAAGVTTLMQRYAQTPMSLADACLVRLAELYPQSPVLTLDSDFAIYRKNGRQVIHMIHP